MAHWRLLSPFTEYCSASLPHVTFITHHLPIENTPLVYVIRCAHRQIRAPVTMESKALKGGVPWPQGRGPSTPLHTHTCAHTRTQFPCTNPTRTTQSHLEQQSPGWASGLSQSQPASMPVSCHAAAIHSPGQQPLRCHTAFSTRPSFLSISDIHHVSQQENTHSSSPQNAPDVIKAREAKENRDGGV